MVLQGKFPMGMLLLLNCLFESLSLSGEIPRGDPTSFGLFFHLFEYFNFIHMSVTFHVFLYMKVHNSGGMSETNQVLDEK